jgi:tRNA (adenine22-N1)-methyltransferase
LSRLNARLAAIAAYISAGDRIADVGTDHGYLPIHLYKKGVSDSLILSDVKQGPLTHAEVNIRQAFGEVPEAFSLRLGDGLEPIKAGETDLCVIAGMGGESIVAILSADEKKTRSIAKFVLQPRTKTNILRSWIYDNGYYVTDEDLVNERGKLCEIIIMTPNDPGTVQLRQYEILKTKNHSLLPAFVEHKQKLKNKIEEARKNVSKDK